jgi:hypothetical protein
MVKSVSPTVVATYAPASLATVALFNCSAFGSELSGDARLTKLVLKMALANQSTGKTPLLGNLWTHCHEASRKIYHGDNGD